MASKTQKKEWSVIQYLDNGYCGALHSSEVNTDDENVKVISTHSQWKDAEKARDAHGKKNKKLTIQK